MLTTLSLELQEASQSFIENLLASEAFMHYQAARKLMSEDEEARILMERLSNAQATVRQKQASANVGQAEIDSIRLIQQRALHNAVILDYAQAQQEAVDFLREINGEISQLLGIDFASFANHATC
jgi:cell fate (sporulation/competence/biofilm development) regulator YlbF (YheA/YmcA/DUF963 family)